MGESESIQFSYSVIDGNGGSVAQTATITITGLNDGPTVGAAVIAGSTEDDAAFVVDLLTGASDGDTSDTLNVSGLTLTTGDSSGITVAGNNLNVDPRRTTTWRWVTQKPFNTVTTSSTATVARLPKRPRSPLRA